MSEQFNRKEVRRVLSEAVRDSHTKEPRGIDYFVEQLAQAVGPEGLVNTYKLAWTKLEELYIILNKAGLEVLAPGDSIKIMQFLLTSSVCIKDSTSARA